MISNTHSLSAVVLFGLASVGSVVAAPSPLDYPEVIPGPGMPSLASLGLTSKDLYEGTSLSGKRDLMARFTESCIADGAPRGDAQACMNYLRSLGTQRCGLSNGQESVIMCTAGAADVGADNFNGGEAVSSYCSDVAIGGQSIIDHCTDGNNNVAGQNAANGNGDLVVWIGRN